MIFKCVLYWQIKREALGSVILFFHCSPASSNILLLNFKNLHEHAFRVWICLGNILDILIWPLQIIYLILELLIWIL